MLLTLGQTAGFLLAAVILTVAPGPDNLMVLGLGLARGRRAGMVFGLGCAAGCLSHTLLAALGVSAAIAASPAAFTVLRWLGGGYLLWLGVQALKSRGGGPLQRADGDGADLGRLFGKGVLANAINPKVVLFFLAFLPQFADPGRGAVGGQVALLGVLFTLQAALLFGALGYFSGVIGGWVAGSARRRAWLDRAAGCVFLGLGVRLIASP